MISDSKSQPMDPTVVDKLLDGLSTNDDFRKLFVDDPGAALEKCGYKAGNDAELRCAQVTTLASKEEIAKTRQALGKYLVSSATSMTVIFNFEAGKIEQSLGKE